MKEWYLILYGNQHVISGLTEQGVLIVSNVLEELNVRYQVYIIDITK